MSDAPIRNMEEFAARCGVSRPTVSKYFHDPQSVRASTRARIEAALERYDYRPNVFAVNQNRKQTKYVGIVVPYLADPFFAELARNLEERCMDLGVRPTLYSAHGRPEMEVEILNHLRSLKPSGVLLAPIGQDTNRAEIEKFCNDVPTVLFDSEQEDVGLAFVGSDNRDLAGQMVSYLSRSGSAPTFLEMATPANPNADRRRASYIAAMDELGLEPQIVQVEGTGWAFEEIGRKGGGEALDSGAFPTNTVLCSNDRLAIGFLSACHERGLRIGLGADADLRIAGQDDHPFARYTCPPLTTMAQDYEAIAFNAVGALKAAIEGRRPETRRTLFGGRLVMRQSA